MTAYVQKACPSCLARSWRVPVSSWAQTLTAAPRGESMRTRVRPVAVKVCPIAVLRAAPSTSAASWRRWSALFRSTGSTPSRSRVRASMRDLRCRLSFRRLISSFRSGWDLRKLRGKQLVQKPRRARRYHVGAPAARTIAALHTLRDQVIAPILAGVRSPKMGRKPAHWTRVDRDYERIRIDMQTLFKDLAIETPLAA